MNRISDELDALSKVERNKQLSENLAEMARVNRYVADKPPRTFREAVQWMCWFSMLSRTYNRGSAGGQLDELLRPYYECEISDGTLDDESVVFTLACLFLQDSRYFRLGEPDINGSDPHVAPVISLS